MPSDNPKERSIAAIQEAPPRYDRNPRAKSEQRRWLRRTPRLSAPRRPAELLSVSPHDRGRGFQPNADAATLVDVRTLGGDAPDDILGGQYRCHRAPP
jgi:hypothetical protein